MAYINMIKLSIMILLCYMTTQTYAAPFYSFDSRSLAMGGTGVASGNSYNASFFNPALLSATKDNEDFSTMFHGGVRVADPDDLLDDADTLNTSVDSLTTLINTYQASETAFNAGNTDIFTVQSNAKAVVDQAKIVVNNDLPAISAKPVELNLGGGLIIAIPNKKLGMAVYTNAHAGGGVVTNVSGAGESSSTCSTAQTNGTAAASTDICVLNKVISDLDAFINTGAGATSVTTINDITYQSDLRFVGIAIAEAGVSLSRKFNIFDGIIVGITPKAMRVETFDVTVTADNADKVVDNRDQFSESHSAVNLDLGIIKVFEEWRFGLVIKNMIAKDFSTKTGGSISIEPQVRIGVARQTSWTTFAIDLDITENDPLGLDKKTEFIAMGAELDLKFLHLRLGYRDNLADNTDADKGVFSVGIGLYFGANLDIALVGNTNDVGGSAQVGFSF